MTIEPFLNHAVVVNEYLGVSGDGRNLYKEGYTISARIEPGSVKVRDKDGNEIISKGEIFMPPGTRISLGSRIDSGGESYTLISIEPVSGFEEHHVEGLLK